MLINIENMLIKSNKIQKEGEENYYVEAVFDSTNILKTTYFPHKERLYISFKRGGTYSYGNIDQELYDDFEDAVSQGVFHADRIKGNPRFPYRKEFTLYPSEIKEADDLIKNTKKAEESKNISSLINNPSMNYDEYLKSYDKEIVDTAIKVWHTYFGFSFDNVMYQDHKFKMIIEGVNEGYEIVKDYHNSSSTDELYNVLTLAKEALKFYSIDINYIKQGNSLESYSQIDNDRGHQAKFALETIEKLMNDRQDQIKKITDLYNDLTSEENPESVLNNLKKTYKGLLE